MQSPKVTAELLAIVEVEHDQRVRCGNPGCGHSVHKAIHVVRDGAETLVLGSTCFNKRYGSGALGRPRYGGGASRTLTPEERELLVANAAALLERLEAETNVQRQKPQNLMTSFESHSAERRYPRAFSTADANWKPLVNSCIRPEAGAAVSRSAPWAWMKPQTSMAGFKLRDGSCWVRVQRKDGAQMLAPWPSFEGWDVWLPGHLGRPKHSLGAYHVGDVRAVIAFLRTLATREKVSGVWNEIRVLLSASD